MEAREVISRIAVVVIPALVLLGAVFSSSVRVQL
jgi:hypothetical protein